MRPKNSFFHPLMEISENAMIYPDNNNNRRPSQRAGGFSAPRSAY